MLKSKPTPLIFCDSSTVVLRFSSIMPMYYGYTCCTPSINVKVKPSFLLTFYDSQITKYSSTSSIGFPALYEYIKPLLFSPRQLPMVLGRTRSTSSTFHRRAAGSGSCGTSPALSSSPSLSPPSSPQLSWLTWRMEVSGCTVCKG